MIADLKPYPAMKVSGVPWLGKVPEHWELRKLRNLLRSIAVRNRPGLPLLSVVREKGVILRDADLRISLASIAVHECGMGKAFDFSDLPRPQAAGADRRGSIEGDTRRIDMDSYRVEKQAAVKIQLPDTDAEIEPVPTSGGGRKPEPELDHLSNILKTFNDQFGNIQWTDADRVRRLITEEIPARVSADTAYQNAKKNSDRQNARIEHDKALARVIVGLMKDDTELFKQFSDNESFKKWLTDTVFTATYEPRPKV